MVYNRAMDKEDKKYRMYLINLVLSVETFLDSLDSEMSQPCSDYYKRGQRIARISNVLNLEKDRAKLFGLNIPLGGKHAKETSKETG